MIKNREKKSGRFLLVFFMFFIFFLSLYCVDAYKRSNPMYSQYSGSYVGTNTAYLKDRCNTGNDFVVQIAPFGCEPAVVRSDLLEEQNVPVFCQLEASNLNPLIDVEAIDSISFRGDYPDEINGVGFHPAKAALGTRNKLNSPILQNIGYVVIVLGKNSNESSMNESLKGNLTAKLSYDVEDVYGLGAAQLYLPEMKESEWNYIKDTYSFWRGNGFLRASSIDDEGAGISVYDDTKKIANFYLGEGNSSREIYLPGYDCLAKFKVKLDKIANPDTSAKIFVGSRTYLLRENEKFLDNNCLVRDIEKFGLYSRVNIRCSEDEETSVFDLITSPRVTMRIGEEEKKDFDLGDKITSLGTEDGESYFLSYIGTKNTENEKTVFDTNKREDLVVYLYKTKSASESLDSDEVENLARKFDSHLKLTSAGNSGIFNSEDFIELTYNAQESINGHETVLLDFSDPVDENFENFKKSENLDSFKEYYKSASSVFEDVVESYPKEKDIYDYPKTDITLGEEAFVEQIRFMKSLRQNRQAYDLCKKFKERYPNSLLYKDIKSLCSDIAKISSSEISQRNVIIDGGVDTIMLDSIREPSFDEYSVEFVVKYPGEKESEIFTLGKDQKIFLDSGEEEKKDFIQLDSIVDNEKVKINVKLDSDGDKEDVSGIKTASKSSFESYGSVYSIHVTNINLERVAKVSIVPSIQKQYSYANFSFQIGIEKRGIKMSPEKTKEKIENLNKSIKEWSDRVEDLGEFVEDLKKTCLSVGGILTITSFLDSLDGGAIARKKVMTEDGGWNEKCQEMVSEEKEGYVSVQDCIFENSNKIEKDVDSYKNIMSQQDRTLKQCQNGAEVETSFLRGIFGEKTYDTEKVMECYVPNARNSLTESRLETIECENKNIQISRDKLEKYISYDNYDVGNFNMQKLKELDFYSRAFSDNPNDEVAKERICEIYGDIEDSSEFYLEKKEQQEELNSQTSLKQVGYSEIRTEDSIEVSYDGGEVVNEKYGDIAPGKKIQIIGYKGNQYTVVLNKISNEKGYYNVKEVYKKDGSSIDEESDDIKAIKRNLIFTKKDSKFYSNKYESSVTDHNEPVVRYYEREPYKGMPAIVPFDLKKGWYAAISHNLPVGGKISSYDKSGRVSSFHVCNVMSNGKEENRKGDDECTMINTGTGQAYNQIGGLDKKDARSLVSDAVKAIESASKAYPASGYVAIRTSHGTEKIKVGKPQVDVSEFKCTDMMSPKSCQILFNVCDPVICPSSRCDFGGSYPVRDVIQSGIIGSVLLCLPNIQEGIFVPVCLSGIYAGLDSYVSILKAYRDCLQESLDSGQTVGICDEIHSVYICDFFWKQSLPVAQMVIPKVFEIATGSNSRGGGEYMNVQSAWENAGDSIESFGNYYSSKGVNAFKTKISTEIQEEVCDSYVSSSYPDDGKITKSLTKPDSPPQFHGRFDENTFTTSTNPPMSHYKVYYHIYSGRESRAYYSVYLKGDASSSYYKDTASNKIVASGYISKGSYESQTKDFTAPSGYKQLCINVNGQEECGFQEVSTSFAANYVSDQYVKDQASNTNIRTESECVSGSPSVYSLSKINPQSIAEDVTNPAVYNEGLIRICANQNPGLNSDSNYPGENQRWVEVGYCGDQDLKCWLDTNSVRDSVNFNETSRQTLKGLEEHTKKKLQEEGNYMSEELMDDEIYGIIEMRDGSASSEEIIEKSDKLLNKAFWNKQKGKLLLEKGKAYVELAKSFYDNLEEKDVVKKDENIEIRVGCKKVCSEEGFEGGTGSHPSGCAKGYELSDNGECCCKKKEATRSFNGGNEESEDGGFTYRYCDSYCKNENNYKSFFVIDSEETLSSCEDLMRNSPEIENAEKHISDKDVPQGCCCYSDKNEGDSNGDDSGDNGEENGNDIENNEDFECVVYNTKDRSVTELRKILNHLSESHQIEGKSCNIDSMDVRTYAKFINDAGDKNNIDEFLLLALMMQESDCNVNAENGDSIGLMQVDRETVNDVCVNKVEEINSFDDIKGKGNFGKNILCGAKILKEKYNWFDNEVCSKNTDCDHPFNNDASNNGDERCFYSQSCGYRYSCKSKDVFYCGWESALRAYNGWSCKLSGGGDADKEYVEDIRDIYNGIVKTLNERENPLKVTSLNKDFIFYLGVNGDVSFENMKDYFSSFDRDEIPSAFGYSVVSEKESIFEAKNCEDCGNGWDNFCDEDECKAIELKLAYDKLNGDVNEYADKSSSSDLIRCGFEDDWGLGGKCNKNN